MFLVQKSNFHVKLDPIITQYLSLDLEQAIGSGGWYPPTRLLSDSGTPFKPSVVISVSRVSAGIADCFRSRDRILRSILNQILKFSQYFSIFC